MNNGLSEDIFQKALWCQRQNHFDEAVSLYKEVLAQDPNRFEALANLGVIYKSQEKYGAAIDSFEQAYSLRSDDVRLNAALGRLLLQQAQFWREQKAMLLAVQLYRKLVALYPEQGEFHAELLEAELQAGNLYEGFREMEWRMRLFPEKNNHQYFAELPKWQGEIFSGKKLVVYCEQGIGDIFQFVRYLPQVKERGGHVTLACPALLVDFLKENLPIDIVTASIQPQEFDLAIALMSLPMIFSTTLNTIPNTVPYLRACQTKVNNWSARISPTESFKIGLVWSGKTNQHCHIRDLAPIVAMEDIAVYSLQKDAAGQQLAESEWCHKIIDCSSELIDFSDTAALLMNLDLLISVDTSVPHLAGALGIPVYLALPFDNEWRWLATGEESPWYPTMRIFRQEKAEKWENLFQRISIEMRKSIDNHNGYLHLKEMEP